MCMYLSAAASSEMRTQIEGGKTTFFKVYKVTGSGTAKTLKQKHQMGDQPVPEDNIIRSDRQSAELTAEERRMGQVAHGIHVYANPPFSNEKFEVVLAVSVEVADFVGCDTADNHCVFTKVAVDPEEVKRKLASTPSEQECDDDDDDEDDDFEDEDDYDDDDDEDDDECPDCGSSFCCGECEDDDDDDFDDDDDD